MIPQNLASELNRPSTIKALATCNANGDPHITFSNHIHFAADGRLVYLEFEEFSLTNRNLVHSLWFNHAIAVHFQTERGVSYEVKGLPWKCLIAGPLYEQYYRDSLSLQEDRGLAALWLITPVSFSEETPLTRSARDEAGRIPLIHLDRLVPGNSSLSAEEAKSGLRDLNVTSL